MKCHKSSKPSDMRTYHTALLGLHTTLVDEWKKWVTINHPPPTPPPNHILFLLASLWLPNKINNWTISPEIFIVLKDSTKDSICFLLLLSPLLHTPTARVQNFRRSDHSSETFLIVFVCFFFKSVELLILFPLRVCGETSKSDCD